MKTIGGLVHEKVLRNESKMQLVDGTSENESSEISEKEIPLNVEECNEIPVPIVLQND